MTLGAGLVLWGKQDDRIANIRETQLEVLRQLADLHKEQSQQDKDIAVIGRDVGNLKERVDGCEKLLGNADGRPR